MYFQPDYPIETPRLQLRPFTRGDIDAVFAYRARDDVAQFLADEPITRVECAELVQRRVGQIFFSQEGDRIVLAADLKETGQLVGEVSLIWRHADWQQGEIGYIFNPEVHGQGLATEAARAVLALGFERFGLHRIMARCDVRNLRSARLMERLGMRREAHFRGCSRSKGRWDEEYVYALLEEEWRQR